MASKLRRDRIAERIRDDLAEMLLQDVSDPRLVGVFVSGVKIDRELAFADIHISALEGSARMTEILDGLEHAKGYLRRGLSQRIDLRSFPRLRFHWDSTAERAERIEEIIATLHREAETPTEPPYLGPQEDKDVSG